MTIYVLGGSNSLMKGGWVEYLARLHPAGEVVNLSIGGTTTLMALFQALRNPDIAPGDTLVWEYAVNEPHHLRATYQPANVLRAVEHLIRLCQRRGMRFAAAVFTQKYDELAPARPPYYDALFALFDHYGVARFDVSSTWRARHRAAHMPADAYVEGPHYKTTPEMMSFIAEGVADAIAKAAIPPDADPVYAGDLVPEIVTIQAAEGEEFRNSILRLTLAPARPTRLTLSRAGRIIAFYAMTWPEAGGLRINLNRGASSGSWIRISTALKLAAPAPGQTPPRRVPLLKAFSVEAATGFPWRCDAGNALEIRPAEGTGRFYAEFDLRAHIDAIATPCRPAFAGLLMETQRT